MRRTLMQLRAELAVVSRNGEQLLLTLVIPLVLLGFFGSVDILPHMTDDPLDSLVPGVLAVAIMSTSMVSLGIATGFERSYLVLKRLGATPLTRGELIGAKALAVTCIELVQFILVMAVAFSMGWSPEWDSWMAMIAILPVASLAFAGIGLLLAGRLKAEVNLAAQNGLYLVLLLLGGTVIPSASLPSWMGSASRVLPSHSLAEVLAAAMNGQGRILQPALVMGAWALAAPLAAARTFRWT